MMSLTSAGCLEDTDCGICDENSLELLIVSGTNYAGELVHIVSPECVGDACPEPFTEARRFVETLGLCELTDAAKSSAWTAEEYCRIAPIVVAGGLQFVFNNLLEPTSIELVRKRPDTPRIFEIYDWKTQVLSIHGPITRYSGDWRGNTNDDRSQMTRFVNLSCIDNLRAAGIDFSAEDYADPATNPCNGLSSSGVPLKLQADKVMTAPRGKWDDRAIGEAAAYDCETPVEGVDTCCSQCDFSLSVQVAKYGAGPRIECDPQGDRLIGCEGFTALENRDDEPDGFVPAADRLRVVHPGKRVDERATIACDSDDGCRDPSGPGLSGAECVGTDGSGRACSPEAGDPDCTQGRCRAPWFVECRADPDTTGDTGYCVDARHDEAAAAGCYTSGGQDTRLSECDANADGHLTAAECCPDETTCDPVYDLGYTALPRYERKTTLSSYVRELACEGGCVDDCSCDGETCSAVDRDCTDLEQLACLFAAQTCSETEDENDYAVNLVTKLGGVIYDGAIKGIEWRPADRGGQPRAVIEACAESRGLIAPRNVSDGWRAHDADGIGVEIDAEWDLSLCSGQAYEAVFQASNEGEHIVDKKGNTLDGKRVYAFETSQFHIVPSSGFPADNLRIGACDTFSLKFSNKFDLSPENLTKIEIHHLGADGVVPVAGGVNCVKTRDEQEAGGIPCLSVDVTDQAAGEIHVRVDAVVFEPVLSEGEKYRLYVPGITDIEATLGDLSGSYSAAFWDACGMPLVLTPTSESEPEYTFTVDPARCEEDGDGDGVQLSCDNAADFYNPGQSDLDRDGVGDPLDLCAASPEIALDTSDSDRDGVGNACDACPDSVSRYNELAATNVVPPALWVRNSADQSDTDQDGIGDVCDNCPTIANCGSYDLEHPWRLGNPIDSDAATCQRDADADMIGDACAGLVSDIAAGPVGFGDADDFDQDGLANLDDGCPRQPELAYVTCVDDGDCGDARQCERVSADEPGVCGHRDSDADGIGDACDTCVVVANASQSLDGGAQQDDDDGDFIGADCELGEGCEDSGDPRPLGFFAVSAAGQCCTTLLVDQGGELTERWGDGRRLEDSVGTPIVVGCSGAGCLELPEAIATVPGVLTLPPGCDQALAAAGMSVQDNRPAVAADVQGDLDALWNLQCRLPARDQDYDGIADACDLCEFDHDPSNAIYVDAEGRSWPNDGAACNGENSQAARCEGEAGTDDGGADDGAGDSSG